MNIAYPVRINRYLAQIGEATRREADRLVEEEKVYINGRIARLGNMVQRGDAVKIKNSVPKKYAYLAYYKPQGIITHSPGPDEKSIEDVLRGKTEVRVFPIGRLDKDSQGLIILTNDGRITEKLLSPEKEHEKEYIVTVDKPVTGRFLRHLERGVDIEGYRTKPAVATEAGEQKFSIIITEGKKHQIRRMCAALGYVARDIKRVRIMNIELGSLQSGQFRIIKGEELKNLLQALKIRPAF
jgi:23S rRNA pseudouridine2604 synthase